jgi:hypothetical protein
VKRAGEVLAWWAVLTGLELMLVSAVDRWELLVAIGLGLLGALVAVAARVAQPTSWSFRAAWLRWLLPLPVAIVGDTARVLVAAARGSTGEWRTIPMADATGEGATARGARAVGALVLSMSPGSIVVDIDPAKGAAKLHGFGTRGGSALEGAVAP